MCMVKVINAAQFDEVKNADVAVVDFSAQWCGPCKMMAPVLEEISGQYEGKVEFFNMDVDENQEIAASYMINSIPNLILFKKGEKVSDSIGFKPGEALKAWIDSNL
ncbi:MAG: thioredoxin [Lachnospiraceae bacterium]|nr:thioredoxin [Lachnospiraceae bacterium]